MALQPLYEPQYYIPLPPVLDYGAYDDPNAIKTLFVSGLPDDVKAREIHNLFRRRPGFESSQLKYTGRGNQGVKFDPQTGSTLHIELARSNSRRKHKPGSGPYVVIDRRTTSTKDTHATSSDDGDSEPDEQTEPNKPESGGKDDLATTKSDEAAVDADSTAAVQNAETERTENTADGRCSTLFIANLGPTCTEEELKEVLSQYPGFNTLRVRSRGGMPVAFADYEEIEQADDVMNALQGSTLPSSDRGGMHIEYARSKMRKR